MAARPAGVVHLGDMVAWGNARHWRDFDQLRAPILAAGIPFLPLRGNHDTWGLPGRARAALGQRFPELVGPTPWRRHRVGALELVLLDSGRARSGPQREWLAHTLAAAQADAGCRGVLAFAHHPPLTNSTATGDHRGVRAGLLPGLRTSSKFMALVSGHVHAFERFALGAAGAPECLVAGGGGGPRVGLRRGARARHHDLCPLPVPRPLHWLAIDVGPAGLQLQVRALTDDGATMATAYAFALPWPAT